MRILVIFHYVIAGLSLLGIAFLWFHFTLMRSLMGSGVWNNGKNAPPVELIPTLKWLYVCLGIALVAGAVLNLLSATFMHARKHRTFSLVVAGLDCLQLPWGTVLGVFTIVVLSRESVRAAYSK